MPEVAPASTAMLQSTRRPEVDILRMVSPWNSSTLKFAPCGADLADEVQDQVLGPDELLEAARHDHLDRGRHLDVEHACRAPRRWPSPWRRCRTQTRPARRGWWCGSRCPRPRSPGARSRSRAGSGGRCRRRRRGCRGTCRCPAAPTNSRTFFWLVAVLDDSAGTRWSKMMATRLGSQIFGGSGVPLIDLEELVDHQRRVLVRHGEVHLGLHHVPGLHRRQAGGAGQDLLNNGHAHKPD